VQLSPARPLAWASGQARLAGLTYGLSWAQPKKIKKIKK